LIEIIYEDSEWHRNDIRTIRDFRLEIAFNPALEGFGQIRFEKFS
jgi:hypothetical protein